MGACSQRLLEPSPCLVRDTVAALHLKFDTLRQAHDLLQASHQALCTQQQSLPNAWQTTAPAVSVPVAGPGGTRTPMPGNIMS